MSFGFALPVLLFPLVSSLLSHPLAVLIPFGLHHFLRFSFSLLNSQSVALTLHLLVLICRWLQEKTKTTVAAAMIAENMPNISESRMMADGCSVKVVDL